MMRPLLAAFAILFAAWGARAEEPLPQMGPAPDFNLTSQDGTAMTLADFRGRALAVAFIFTRCGSTCPLLTAKMAVIQDALGGDFGSRVAFVSITLDPEYDTPPVLKSYADLFGARLSGWTFLTGEPAAVEAVIRSYGLFAAKAPDGGIDHTGLTSLVDPEGMLRVQYLGTEFDPEEFRRDLLSLADGD
jgi:protein SCO1/2